MATHMISDRELAKMESAISTRDKKIEKLSAREVGGAALGLGEAAGAAGIMGFIRGHFEKSGKAFAVGPVDIELAVGVGLFGLSMWKKGVGKYGEDVRMMGLGVLSHYTGQLGRAFGKGQAFSPIIGMLPDHVGSSYRHSSFGAPFANREFNGPIAGAHARGGLDAALRAAAG